MAHEITTNGASELQAEQPFDGETLLSVVENVSLSQEELAYLHCARSGGSTYGGLVCQERTVVPCEGAVPCEGEPAQCERWLRLYNKAFATVLLLDKPAPSEGHDDKDAEGGKDGADGQAGLDQCEILSFFKTPPKEGEPFNEVFPPEELYFLEGWGKTTGQQAERAPCFIDRASRDRCVAGGYKIGWRALRVRAEDYAETGKTFLFAVEGCVMRAAPAESEGARPALETDETVIKAAFERVLAVAT